MADSSEPAGDADQRQRPAFEPLTILILLLAAWNAVVLWMVYNGTMDHSVGNDAAGAGMARDFRELFAMAGAIGVSLLAVPYFLIRNRAVRIVLATMLALASLLTPMML